jgi:hypothetical protein
MMSVKASPADRLWLMRAVQAEGEPRRAVAEALVNLYALHASKGGASSLAEIVRAYAQPVNPRWFESGDLFRAALEKAPEAARPVMLAAARRRERLHSTRNKFDAATLDAVAYALAGVHRTDVTDYAAPNVDAARKGYVARSDAQPGRNRLWTRAPGWAGYVAAAAPSSVVPFLIAALVLGAALAARG